MYLSIFYVRLSAKSVENMTSVMSPGPEEA